MADHIDFFGKYVMGCMQILLGFHFYTGFLKKKVKPFYYIVFAAVGIIIINVVQAGRFAEFLIYALMLTAGGAFVCRADGKLRQCKSFQGKIQRVCRILGSFAADEVFLYAVLTVAIMQLSYGMVNSLSCILYPFVYSFWQRGTGFAFMVLGEFMALAVTAFCYRMVKRYFSYYETVQKKYVLMILTPIAMIFFVEEYISSIIYGNVIVTDGSRFASHINHGQMFMIQLLGMASLFCIMFAYKKLLENFRLSTELSILAKEEHYLNQYVEEAKAHYDKTRSFRHDIKNHITVLKELLQNGKSEQALHYIGDMEYMTEELSFPCSTNNPVADVLIGNKLGIAEEMGIEVQCSLLLPYPCLVRDIDLCIILSNALDNALHACGCMDDSTEKYIHVSGCMQGDFVLVEVINSFQGKSAFRMGTGLSNIRAVAEKYHGTINAQVQDGTFVLSVLLVIPQHSENIPRQIS